MIVITIILLIIIVIVLVTCAKQSRNTCRVMYKRLHPLFKNNDLSYVDFIKLAGRNPVVYYKLKQLYTYIDKSRHITDNDYEYVLQDVYYTSHIDKYRYKN